MFSLFMPYCVGRRAAVVVGIALLSAVFGWIPVRADEPCVITPSEFWKNSIEFPHDGFRVIGDSDANPDWVKFSIFTCDPTHVYFQDSREYTFHYDFVRERVDPYIGISESDFNDIALYEDGQEIILGAVLMPASSDWSDSYPLEYGIQFVRYDPYSPEEIVAMFSQVRSAIVADPDAEGFYFPSYEQHAVAQEHAEYFASQGIIVSSSARWAEGNAVYSDGWALGRIKFFPGDQIEQAYLSGELLAEDILLTDGLPAEIPFVAGVMTLMPTTPNSHVVILANNYGIPLVHVAMQADADRAMELIGYQAVLRAYDTAMSQEFRLIDVEGVLDENTIAEILALKALPELDIAAMQTLGAYSGDTDDLVLSDTQYFGGKASNYGFLRRAIPDDSPVACALSFDVWNAFMDQVLPSGLTLRETIQAKLAEHAWPPDMAQLAADLADIREMIQSRSETSFAEPLRDAIIATLQDETYGFDAASPIRFRSSTNVEDSEQFTGAGLYESYSGCLADDLDGDAAQYHSSWPCADAVGMDDIHPWTLSAVGDSQGSDLSANGDTGNPGVFVSEPCPIGACCIDGVCSERTHSECVVTYGGWYRGDGTSCSGVSCPTPGDALMRITEYMYSGGGGEFIEFCNVGTEPIDMAGWSFDDSSAAAGTVDLSAFGVVMPGEAVVLTEDSAGAFAADWGLSGVNLIGGLTANLGRNDEINLFDSAGALVDRLTYGDEAFPGTIRARDAAGWPCGAAIGANSIYGWRLAIVGDAQGSHASANGDIGSPGAFVVEPCPAGACCVEGVCIDTTQPECIGVHGGVWQGDGTSCATTSCPPPTIGQMRISEYMSKGSGGEFIEFTNVGVTPVDMTGWSYDDESGVVGTVDLSAFGVVAPGESVILAEDSAAAFEGDWGLDGVKIIGDLTVNLGGSDAIHLYDASGSLVDRLGYEEDEGPSHCDAGRADEQSVFDAIRKVFASFYNLNAVTERLRYGVNEADVGMGVLVHHSFPDEIELANGVATVSYAPPFTSVYLVTQLGAVSVANPEGGAIPEEVRVSLRQSGAPTVRVERSSSLVVLGETVLDFTGDYLELAYLMRSVAEDYAAAVGTTPITLDFEYKKVAPGGTAMLAGGLVIKQVRRLPRPDTTPSIVPYLIGEPLAYEVFQGQAENVFANHRLKSRWSLSSRSMWLTAENLAGGLHTDCAFEYTDGCWRRYSDAPLSELPEAWYAYEEPWSMMSEGWTFGDLASPRQYELQTSGVETLVSKAESPVLTPADFDGAALVATYDEPVPALNGLREPIMTLTDSVELRTPPFEPDDADTLQERVLTDPESPIVITTHFYWPSEDNGIWIFTSPLDRFEETIIEGLTTEPIVLHGYYSQTYQAEHHNHYEHFLFEPRLEPGLSPSIKAELDALGVQLIYALKAYYPWERRIDLYDADGCEILPCETTADCGYPAYARYCEKPLGDCAAVGVCVAMPEVCDEAVEAVCGCDGATYDNDCAAAMSGASVAYAGGCVVGDCNLDGVVDMFDRDAFVSILLGLDDERIPAADLNGDGAADGRDVPLFIDVLLEA